MGFIGKITDQLGNQYDVSLQQDVDDSGAMIFVYFMASIFVLIAPFAVWYGVFNAGDSQLTWKVFLSLEAIPVWLLLFGFIALHFVLIRKQIELDKRIALSFLISVICLMLIVVYIGSLGAQSDGVTIVPLLAGLILTMPTTFYLSKGLRNNKQLLISYIIQNVVLSLVFINVLYQMYLKIEFDFTIHVLLLGFIVTLLCILPGFLIIGIVLLGRKIHARKAKKKALSH